MAKRKGTTSNPTDTDGEGVRAFAVVLEGVRSDFKAFGEALSGFRDETLGRFDRMDRRLDEHDRRFDKIDQRFDEHDSRFGQQESRFDRIDRDIALVKVAVTEIRKELKKKVDRDEVVAIVEEVIGRRG